MKKKELLCRHIFRLLSSSLFVYACGTTSSDLEGSYSPDLSRADSAYGDGSGMADILTETDVLDLSDTPSEDANISDVSSSDEGQPNDSSQVLDTDASLDGSGNPAACTANIVCMNAAGIVIGSLALDSTTSYGTAVTCEVLGMEEAALDASLWQYGGQTESAFVQSGQRRITFVPALPEPQLIRVRTGCGAAAETILGVAPPAHETLIVGSWSSSLPEATWDADLYVRRNINDCWNNPDAVMVPWSPGQRLDWGILGRDSDDPHASADARWLPAYESVWCESPDPSENWEIAIRVPIDRPSEAQTVQLRIWSNGELVADETRALNSAFADRRWWSVGFFNPLIGWSPADQILVDRPTCDSICAGGGSAWPEACNGLDDDCNGTVDDSACSTGVCVYIPTLDRFQCVAP